MKTMEQNSINWGWLLFVEFLEKHLRVKFVGFQSGFKNSPDLLLFEGALGSTLSVPASTMYLPAEAAQQITQAKISASVAAFNTALDTEDLEAINRFWAANSEQGIRETSIGQELLKRRRAA